MIHRIPSGQLWCAFLLTGAATVVFRCVSADSTLAILAPRIYDITDTLLPLLEQHPHVPALRQILILGTFCFSILICVLVRFLSTSSVVSNEKNTQRQHQISCQIRLVVPLVCVGLSALNRWLWIILLTIAGIGLLISIFPSRRTAYLTSPASHSDKMIQISHLIPLIIAALVGFSCEEAWRSFDTLSVVWSTMPFLIVLLVGTFFLAGSKHIYRYILLVGGATLFILTRRAGFSAVSITSITLLVSVIVTAHEHDILHPRTSSLLLPACGCGAALGIYAINQYGDLTNTSDQFLGSLGEVSGLKSVMGYLIGGLSVLVSIATCIYIIRLHTSERVRALRLLEEQPRMKNRLEGFFSSKGLNETQTQVMQLILDGQSVVQISEHLNYSRGTINSARAAGYEKLGVHSRRELIDCVSAGIGRVN